MSSAEQRRPDLAPIAIWLTGCVALIALATFGPRLWARQAGDNATIATQIVAVGQALLFAIGLPFWTKSTPTTRAAIVLSAPLFVLLAASVEPTSVGYAFEVATRVTAYLAILSTIWAFAARRRQVERLWWIVVLAVTAALPGWAFLANDYAFEVMPAIQWSATRLLTTTFLH